MQSADPGQDTSAAVIELTQAERADLLDRDFVFRRAIAALQEDYRQRVAEIAKDHGVDLSAESWVFNAETMTFSKTTSGGGSGGGGATVTLSKAGA